MILSFLAICDDCSATNGKCISPGVCKCKPGYEGEDCETCKLDKFCNAEHANCNGPNQCNCLEGYTGKYCHIGKYHITI